MKKKITALLVAIAIILPMIPVSGLANSVAAAAESTALLRVEEAWANPDGTVDVNLVIDENPGILGATFTVSWGEGMEMIGDANGSAFDGLTYQAPSRYVAKGTNFIWYGNSVGEVKALGSEE